MLPAHGPAPDTAFAGSPQLLRLSLMCCKLHTNSSLLGHFYLQETPVCLQEASLDRDHTSKPGHRWPPPPPNADRWLLILLVFPRNLPAKAQARPVCRKLTPTTTNCTMPFGNHSRPSTSSHLA